MEGSNEILEKILDEKFVAVVRGNGLDEGSRIIEACKEGGIKLIEITYTNKDASILIKKYSEDKALCVGAGTVTDIETAKESIKNGSKFIVAPNFSEEIAEYCNNVNVLYIPGCLTPTEIIKAKEYCKMIKLFPGNLVGPRYVKDIKAPIPDIKIMVTGGVNIENINQWLEYGAEAIGIGGVLTEGTDLEHQKIVDKARGFIAKVN